MKIKLLAEISKNHEAYHITSSAEPRLVIIDNDLENGLKRLSEYFEKHLHKTLGKWIEYIKSMGSEDECNCPQGHIELPIDLWKCKLDNSTCSLQAKVNFSNKEEFYNGCTANEVQKDGIFSAITEGKYDGFHHVAGRYLCVSCEANPKIKTNFQYHYEIELHHLQNLLTVPDEEIKEKLRWSKYPSSSTFCAICTDCALDVIHQLFPSEIERFRKLEINYYER